MSTRSVIFWVGLDVHKDSITAAVFRGRNLEPLRVDRIANEPKRIRRYFERLQRDGQARACYEASGAGDVLQQLLLEWGISCELAAPSLIPRRAGEHRKTDRRDAIEIARDFRDDRLVLIHIPTEEEERSPSRTGSCSESILHCSNTGSSVVTTWIEGSRRSL